MHNKLLPHQQAGATMVELIISIVIVSTTIAGVLGIINLTVLHSADPIAQQQAIAIAESYIEEITALPTTDPDGTNNGETRATFDNVDDYNGLSDTGVIDQVGNIIANLDNYNVSIVINNQTINGLANMREIAVTVQRPGIAIIKLVAYKAP
ncbi:MAG: MSHA pilin protein MshD [Methylophagaceae bacterium]|jgi:MSHA pilin protein MshD